MRFRRSQRAARFRAAAKSCSLPRSSKRAASAAICSRRSSDGDMDEGFANVWLTAQSAFKPGKTFFELLHFLAGQQFAAEPHFIIGGTHGAGQVFQAARGERT